MNNKKNTMVIIMAAALAVMAVAIIILSVNTIALKKTLANDNGTPDNSISSQNMESQSNVLENQSSAQQTEAANALGEITIEEAKNIAIERAGVSKESLVYISAHEERDRNTAYYEVEFSDVSYEYKYKIDLSGNIIFYDKDSYHSKANSNIASSSNAEYIGVDKAKSIALADCGLSDSDVSYTKEVLERENGTFVYELEFKSSSKEYEYEIDAFSGKILEQSIKSAK